MSLKKFARRYRCTDSNLKQNADQIYDLTIRDATEFLTMGVTDATRTAFRAMINDFAEVPTDVYMRGKLRKCTDDKDSLVHKVLNACGIIRTMARNKWGEDDPGYGIYGWEGMSELPDAQLVTHARMVAYVAAEQLSEGAQGIVTEGLTQAMIDDITAKNTDLDKSIDKMHMAEKDRGIKAQERIVKGNIVFKEYKRLCNIGKELFHNSDPARYDDYLIGMSNAEDAQPEDKFGNIGGKVINSANHEPLADVELTLKGEGLPDVVLTTDADGRFEEDHVLTTYTTIEASLPHFNLVTTAIIIPPDDELLLDIELVASP